MLGEVEGPHPPAPTKTLPPHSHVSTPALAALRESSQCSSGDAIDRTNVPLPVSTRHGVALVETCHGRLADPPPPFFCCPSAAVCYTMCAALFSHLVRYGPFRMRTALTAASL